MSSKFRNNRRLQRRLRKQEKRGVVIINLVSMIDMFTALVFFLLVITSSVVTMRNPNSVTLPNSLSMKPPAEDVPVLIVTRSKILLQGQPVMSVTDAEKASGEILEPLRKSLLAVPLTENKAGKSAKKTRGRVNIMADRSTPYSLLKKVMATCGVIDFTNISLSVNHVPRHRT